MKKAKNLLRDEVATLPVLLGMAEDADGPKSPFAESMRDHMSQIKEAYDDLCNAPMEDELASLCASAVNSFGFKPKVFATALSREHRTLQQTFTKVCVAWLSLLAETENYDDRNEASVMFARSIKKQLDECRLPMI